MVSVRIAAGQITSSLCLPRLFAASALTILSSAGIGSKGDYVVWSFLVPSSAITQSMWYEIMLGLARENNIVRQVCSSSCI